MGNNGLIWAKKSKNLKFEQEEMCYYQFVVKFNGKSNGDSLDALKRCSDPEIGHKGLIGAEISKKSKILARRKVRPPLCSKISGSSTPFTPHWELYPLNPPLGALPPKPPTGSSTL